MARAVAIRFVRAPSMPMGYRSSVAMATWMRSSARVPPNVDASPNASFSSASVSLAATPMRSIGPAYSRSRTDAPAGGMACAGTSVSSSYSGARLSGAAEKSCVSVSRAPHAHASARGRYSQPPRAARTRPTAGARSSSWSGSSARPRREVIRPAAGGLPAQHARRAEGDELAAWLFSLRVSPTTEMWAIMRART